MKLYKINGMNKRFQKCIENFIEYYLSITKEEERATVLSNFVKQINSNVNKISFVKLEKEYLGKMCFYKKRILISNKAKTEMIDNIFIHELIHAISKNDDKYNHWGNEYNCGLALSYADKDYYLRNKKPPKWWEYNGNNYAFSLANNTLNEWLTEWLALSK